MSRVWICIPYAGEPVERLDMTIASAHACKPAGVYVQRDRHRSLPKTLNEAARQAIALGATHIMWLSTGDTVRPTRLQTPPPMDKGEFTLTWLESRGCTYPDPEEYKAQDVYKDNQFCLSGAIVPVPVWEKLEGLDESLTYCSDWELAVRVEALCGWVMLPIVLVVACEYEDGLTKGADVRVRQQDRSRVSRMARELGRTCVSHGPSPV